jgi:hypothetical protein
LRNTEIENSTAAFWQTIIQEMLEAKRTSFAHTPARNATACDFCTVGGVCC